MTPTAVAAPEQPKKLLRVIELEQALEALLRLMEMDPCDCAVHRDGPEIVHRAVPA